MKKNKIIRFSLLLFISFTLINCEVFDSEDGLVDPNNPTPDAINPDFLLSNIQIKVGDTFFFNLSEMGMEITRMKAMGGDQYQVQFDPGYFRADNAWGAYSGENSGGVQSDGYFADIQLLKQFAANNPDVELNFHLGIAKTIEAYTIVTLVDYFGDVPYSEAFMGSTNLNPNVDNSADLYAIAHTLLDEAETHFNDSSSFSGTDFYYEGSSTSWIRLINTLRLKFYLQTRLVDSNAQAEITQILNDGNIITDASQDWAYRYGTNDANPDTRSFNFTQNYGIAANDYMSNSYMNELVFGPNGQDPRWRYYFYRQVAEVSTDFNELPCINNPRPAHYDADEVYCALDFGFWGRDHLDSDGIPPDGTLRTVFGVYPVGGKFDDSSTTSTEATDGLMGAGLEPMMMSSFVDFMQVEIALVFGIGDAEALLESAVRKSISTVLAFGASVADPDRIPSQEDIDEFVTSVIDEFNAASGNDEKLNVAARQYWIAAFGNGVEIYNMYRRTGYPTDLQPSLELDFGTFPRSLWYPALEVDLNSSISQKPSLAEQVFWDNNPAGFIE